MVCKKEVNPDQFAKVENFFSIFFKHPVDT